MQKLFKWLDENLISILSGVLLIFIPLYPKLPLFEALPGYIVRVRLEDFFVSFTILLWIVYLVRGKITLFDNPLLKPIVAYLTVGLMSVVSAIFIIQTVPLEMLHINKMLLHFLRRIEYFSLFFIFYSTIKSIRQVKIYLFLTFTTILGVAIYGFGQKYLYWPAFSTMNREFSKGWVLYLTEHARVLSTFGGHYDLAAFIMMALLLLWSLFFAVQKIFYKIFIFIILACAFWTLILTASRASFIAYLAGLPLMFLFWAYKKGIRWSISRWFTVTVLSIVVMLSFGDLSERFTKLLRIDERMSGIKLLLLSPIGKAPIDKAIFLENNPKEALAQITSKSDQPPTPNRPSDVYQDMPLMIPIATGSATVAAVPRTYSKTAYIYDLSTAIRLDALWPMAIKGFKKNPLLGSGYSNLNKTQLNQFTEAESTDNDYLRALGETGIFGFITFYGSLFILLYYIWRHLAAVEDNIVFGAMVALGGIVLGLLTNATYIDVFESSKVAFTFWGLTGLILGGIKIERLKHAGTLPKPAIPGLVLFKKKLVTNTISFLRSDLFVMIIILSVSLILRLYKINTPLADWHSWRQADTSAVTRNFVKQEVNLLYPTYDDLSNVASGQDNPKGLRLVEFPLYNFASVIVDKIFVGYNVEFSGRLTSILSSLGSTVILFLLVRKYSGRFPAISAASIFTLIPYNIYYSRVILPEPFLVFLSLLMIYLFDKLIEKINKIYEFTSQLNIGKETAKIIILTIFSIIITAAALLVKPYAAFLFLPMIYLWFSQIKISLKSVIFLVMYFVLVSLPFIGWRYWISFYPEGVPAYTWLLNGDGIRFKGAFFQWIFADRLGRLILGYWGLPLLFAGLIAKSGKEKLLYYIWAIAIVLYLFVVATGNVRHDYYQTLTVPIIAIFMAKGMSFIFESATNTFSRLKNIILLIMALVFMLMFGWYHVRDFYNINHPEIVDAGGEVERKTPQNALVIAPYNGDTAFLYQTRRAGWPIVQENIDKMIKMGADYYVSVNFDELTKKLILEAINPDETKRKYKLIEQTDKYVIIQLVPDRDLPK